MNKCAIFFISILGFSFNAFAYEQCTDEKINNTVTTIQTDAAINNVVNHIGALVRTYPEVKNCAAFASDLCTVTNHFYSFYAGLNCEVNKTQQDKLDNALEPLFLRQFSTPELLAKADAYWNECFPNDEIQCVQEPARAAHANSLKAGKSFASKLGHIFKQN